MSCFQPDHLSSLQYADVPKVARVQLMFTKHSITQATGSPEMQHPDSWIPLRHVQGLGVQGTQVPQHLFGKQFQEPLACRCHSETNTDSCVISSDTGKLLL